MAKFREILDNRLGYLSNLKVGTPTLVVLVRSTCPFCHKLLWQVRSEESITKEVDFLTIEAQELDLVKRLHEVVFDPRVVTYPTFLLVSRGSTTHVFRDSKLYPSMLKVLGYLAL